MCFRVYILWRIHPLPPCPGIGAGWDPFRGGPGTVRGRWAHGRAGARAQGCAGTRSTGAHIGHGRAHGGTGRGTWDPRVWHMGVYGSGYIWGGGGGRGGRDSPPRSDPSPTPYGEGLARHGGKYHIHSTPVTYIYPTGSINIQRRVWPRTATGLLSGPRAPTVEHQRARRCIGTPSIVPTRGLTTRAWGRDSLEGGRPIRAPVGTTGTRADGTGMRDGHVTTCPYRRILSNIVRTTSTSGTRGVYVVRPKTDATVSVP